MIDCSASVQVSELVKQYRERSNRAVDQVSFSIKKGEIFGLLGPNGAGKTTTIKMLCGLLTPTQGTAKICGYDIQKELKKIKPLIGVVPQDIALYPNFTAAENLSIFSRLYGLDKITAQNKIQRMLDTFGLLKHAKKKVKTYSGGMKRRLNIIAAILHDPKVVFLDEPTVGIDIQSKVVIHENLKKISQKGTAMIYTSHQMEETEALCSHIAVIDHGRSIAEGSPAELILKTPNAKNLEDVYLHLTGKKLRD